MNGAIMNGAPMNGDNSGCALRAEGLTLTFVTPRSTTHAVQDVSLSIGERDFAGIMGPSGSGKTSLLYLLAAGVVSTVAFLCYFGALGMSDSYSSRVQPLDRLSLVFAIILAAMFLREKATPQVILGAGLMAVGAVVIALAGTGQK